MKMENKYGLLPHIEDERDFKVGAVMDLPKLSELPESFSIPIPDEWILKQSQDDCAGHATSLASSTQEGVRLDPKFTWVMARYMNGVEPLDWGLSLRDAMDAHRKIGAIELKDSPYKEEDEGWRDVSKWNVGELLKKSVVHKKGAVIWVEPTQGYDMYDTIRALIWKYQTPVVIGMRWPYGSDYTLDEWQDGGYGHAVVINGWNKTDEDGKNSWGLNYGINGGFTVCREIINKETPKYGAGLFIDETPEKIKYYIENGIKLDMPWMIQILKAIVTAFSSLLSQLKEATKTGVPPYPNKIVRMAEAIKKHEGWYPGSRSYRNNNPANAKFMGQYNTTGFDDKGFAIFKSYEAGWEYLQKILYNACVGKSYIYKPDMTLYEYFAKYAPSSDDNDPKRYAEVVAWHIGVEPSTQLKDLII